MVPENVIYQGSLNDFKMSQLALKCIKIFISFFYNQNQSFIQAFLREQKAHGQKIP